MLCNVTVTGLLVLNTGVEKLSVGACERCTSTTL
jgi:hypothetical protein